MLKKKHNRKIEALSLSKIEMYFGKYFQEFLLFIFLSSQNKF